MKTDMLNRFFKKILNYFTTPIIRRLDKIQEEVELNRILLAQQLIVSRDGARIVDALSEVEFRVFSQWGEDGIIQYLISKIPIPHKIFVEFGVEDYRESNTRFLLMQNNWSGLVMDGSAQNIERIRSKSLYWRHDLVARQAFITVENINSLIQEAGIHGDIGLLSIDIDGNDYWVWKAISEETISPRIVIVEYNSVLGKERAVTIPYSPDFQRTQAHYSNLYFGASLKAFCQLAMEKKYLFVGSNSAGNNAFFVRSDVIGNLFVMDSDSGYVETKVRQARDKSGKLIYETGLMQLYMIAHLPVVDLETGRIVKLEEVASKNKKK